MEPPIITGALAVPAFGDKTDTESASELPLLAVTAAAKAVFLAALVIWVAFPVRVVPILLVEVFVVFKSNREVIAEVIP